MKKLLIIVLLVFVTNMTSACESTEHEFSRTIDSKSHIVRGPLTIKQLEESNQVKIRETKKKLPFGYINKEWEKLKSQYMKGDEFYFVRYESDERFFMEQHVLVRDGCIIGHISGAIS